MALIAANSSAFLPQETDKSEGYGGRSGCSRQDGGESNPNGWPEHDQQLGVISE